MPWTYSAQIPIDTSITGADIATDQANFPLLVRLTPSNFDFSQAAVSGVDIRFEDRDGFPLSYELDSWNSGINADLWVSVNNIWGDRADNYIVMRWGNPTATGVSNGQAVFSPSYGYVLVAHMEDLTDLQDSVYGLSGANTGTTAASGVIGNGAEWDGGSSDYIDYTHDATQNNNNLFENGSGCTFSILAKTDVDFDSSSFYRATLASKGGGYSSANEQDWYWYIDENGPNGTDSITFELRDSTDSNWLKYGTTALTWDTGTWYHIQATYSDSDTFTFYRNGASEGTDTGAGAYSNGNNHDIRLGKHYTFNNSSYWDGVLDEFRIQNVERSSDWISLEYSTQNVSATTLVHEQFETAAVTRVSVPTSTGIFDIECPGLSGQIPKAVLFFTPNAWTVDTEHPDESYGYGMAVDALKQYTFYGFSNDNSSNTSTYKGGTDDHCIWIASATGGAADGEAEFVSFLPSGCRVNWDNAPSQAAVTHALFFAGEDVEADAGLTLPASGTNSTVSISGNFEPNIFFLGMIGDNFDGTPSTTHFTCFGIGTNYSGTLRQAGFSRWSADNTTGGDLAVYVSNQHILTEPTNATSVRYNIELSNPNVSGFDLITRNGTADSGDDIAYLTVKMPNSATWVGVEDTPTSTGIWNIATNGVNPSLGMLIAGTVESEDSLVNTANANSYGVGFFDGTNDYSATMNDRDGIDPSDNYTRYNSDLAVYVESATASNEVISGVFSSFASGELNLNLTSTDDENKKFIVFAYGTPGPTAVSTVIIDRDIFRGIMEGIYRGVY